MPTQPKTRRKRYLVTGHFDERTGYRVDRPSGCHDWLVIYTRRGCGRFEYDGGWIDCGSHEAVLIAPQTPHGYRVAPSARHWELFWAHFVPPTQWRTWLQWQSPSPGWGHVGIADATRRKEIIDRFQTAVHTTAGYRHHRETLAMNALESVLLICHEQVVETRGKRLDPRIEKALDFVCRHLHEPLTVDRLARQCHLSPSRFAHLFREQMEMAPQQFVEHQRMERARELLEHTGYPVASIARRVGFECPFYFTRRFKRATGSSPRNYRAHR